ASVPEPVADLPAVVARVAHAGPVAVDGRVLDRDAVPDPDLEQVRDGEGVAGLGRAGTAVVVAHAEVVVAERHAVVPPAVRDHRVDGADRAGEPGAARRRSAVEPFDDELEWNRRLHDHPRDAEAGLPHAGDREVPEVVGVPRVRRRDLPRVGDARAGVERGAAVALVEDVRELAGSGERQLAVDARQKVAQHPAAAREQDALLIGAEARTGEGRHLGRIGGGVPPLPLEPDDPSLLPEPAVERRRREAQKRRPRRAEMLERERRIAQADEERRAAVVARPVLAHERLDEADRVVVGARVAAIVDVAVPVELRLRAPSPRQLHRGLERELRDRKARDALEIARGRDPAVTQLSGSALLPARRLAAARDAEVDERAQRERPLALDCVRARARGGTAVGCSESRRRGERERGGERSHDRAGDSPAPSGSDLELHREPVAGARASGDRAPIVEPEGERERPHPLQGRRVRLRRRRAWRHEASSPAAGSRGARRRAPPGIRGTALARCGGMTATRRRTESLHMEKRFARWLLAATSALLVAGCSPGGGPPPGPIDIVRGIFDPSYDYRRADDDSWNHDDHRYDRRYACSEDDLACSHDGRTICCSRSTAAARARAARTAAATGTRAGTITTPIATGTGPKSERLRRRRVDSPPDDVDPGVHDCAARTPDALAEAEDGALRPLLLMHRERLRVRPGERQDRVAIHAPDAETMAREERTERLGRVARQVGERQEVVVRLSAEDALAPALAHGGAPERHAGGLEATVRDADDQEPARPHELGDAGEHVGRVAELVEGVPHEDRLEGGRRKIRVEHVPADDVEPLPSHEFHGLDAHVDSERAPSALARSHEKAADEAADLQDAGAVARQRAADRVLRELRELRAEELLLVGGQPSEGVLAVVVERVRESESAARRLRVAEDGAARPAGDDVGRIRLREARAILRALVVAGGPLDAGGVERIEPLLLGADLLGRQQDVEPLAAARRTGDGMLRRAVFDVRLELPQGCARHRPGERARSVLDASPRTDGRPRGAASALGPRADPARRAALPALNFPPARSGNSYGRARPTAPSAAS